MLSLLSLLLLLLLLSRPAVGADVVVDVDDYGAVPDGVTESSAGFHGAWAAACGSSSGTATVYAKGDYLVDGLVFSGPCNCSAIRVVIDGSVVAPADYTDLENSGYWILVENVAGVFFSGGVIDGNGSEYWACKNAGDCNPDGARSLTFNGVTNGVIEGLTSRNSKGMHIVIDSSTNVNVSDVRIDAPSDSPNTDGIHVEASTETFIRNPVIKTGDDCISIGPGSKFVSMEGVFCGPGHGVSIGSLGWKLDEAGVENVTLNNSTFTDTENGVRMKTWARPSNGFARNVEFKDIVMNDVHNPLVIDQHYCPHDECPHGNSGVEISDVSYVDIKGTSASKLAIDFNCSSTTPCRRIAVDSVQLTYTGPGNATSFCNNIVDGTSNGTVLPAVDLS